jgi:PAS domain S-box-containing protein
MFISSIQELAALFNNVSIGIVVINRSGEIVMVNHFLLNQFGYSEDEVLGRKIEMLIPQRFRQKHVGHRETYAEHPHKRAMGIGMELHAVKKDGTEFPVDVSLSPYTKDGSEFTIGFVSDITIRKDAEHALLHTNSHLEKKVQEFGALFNNMAIGIVSVNENGTIVLTNQFALNKFGYTEDELIGQKIELLIPDRYKHKHVKHRDHYASSPHTRSMGIGMDLYAMKKDGTEFPVEISLSPYQTKDGQYTVAFISDITIRKEVETALIQLNQELEEKVKERTESLSASLEKEKDLNEMKSRFVSMASHEFRTPLSTILSSAHLALKYNALEDQPKKDKHLNRIISSVKILTDILDDFLSLGKIEEGKIQVRKVGYDIQEGITGIINEMANNLKNGQTFIYNHHGPEQIQIDSSLIAHIIMNLFSNAIKFSPENTAIEVNTYVENSEFRLSVKDAGIGISAEDQEHLFERFFRGTNVSNIQGTGLGLHIIKKYAELMDGTITCNSEAGKGTEFIVTLQI